MVKGHPLFSSGVIVRADGKTEMVGRVVVTSQVREDGRILSDGEVGAIVVDDGCYTTIRVDGEESGILLLVLMLMFCQV